MRRVRLSVAAALAASLMLAACGGGDDDSGDDESSGPDQMTEQEAKTWPLTGLEADGSVKKKHPVMVVKMDNTSSSAPQMGLGEADLIVEELVEGGSTRLAAFYYSTMPKTAGPVRSMRASDIGIVTPVKANVVTSGAAPVTIQRIQDAGIKFFGEGSTGFFRESSRSAPYNLMVRLDELAKSQNGKAARPDDYLPWGSDEDLPAGKKASSLSASFGGSHSTEWTFRDGGYHNDNSYAAEGDRFVADNVLVIRVKVGDAGYTDPAGNPVPESKFEGTGKAQLFHNGRVVNATWEKEKLGSPVTLKVKGEELEVPAGKTFIELVPAGNGNVTFTK